MAARVTAGAVARMLATPAPDGPVSLNVQVLEPSALKENSQTVQCMVTDGAQKCKAMLNEMIPHFREGRLAHTGIVHVLAYNVRANTIVVTKCQVLEKATNKEVTASDAASAESAPSPQVAGDGGGVYGDERGKQDEQAGRTVSVKAEEPTATPPEQQAQVAELVGTPQAPAKRQKTGDYSASPPKYTQTMRTSMPSMNSRRVYPIEAINPYQASWTIKARVTSKSDKRSYTSKQRGDGGVVFTVELTDEKGTQIQATAWKEDAERLFDRLEMGQVYLIAGGRLRPANRRFTNVANDYEITFTKDTIVELCQDAESSIPEAKLNTVPMDSLGLYIPKEGADPRSAPLVDVAGVIHALGEVDTIRRRSDNQELVKRDVTLVDQSAKTVRLTLWNKLAEEEGLAVGTVIAVRAVRVHDYNGVSLSTVSKSQVLVEPKSEQAAALRAWWSEEGSAAVVSPLAAGGGGAGARGGRNNERKTLADVTAPGVGDDKTEYFSVRARVKYIGPDQQFWYSACPKDGCNKKVTEDTTGVWCEGCSQHYDTFRRRYILNMRLVDSTCDAFVVAFHDQARAILGIDADELASLRESSTESSDPDQKGAFKGRLQEVFFTEYVYRLACSVREYNNEKRQRLTIVGLEKVDYAAESKRMLAEIAAATGGITAVEA